MAPKLGMAKALALDGNGVVYRRKREVVDALVEALASQGLIFSKEKLRSVYLELQERAFTGELPYKNMVEELHRQLSLGSQLALASLDQLIQKFSADIEIYPELPSVLRELRSRGIRVGMLTNSIHPAQVKAKWLRNVGVDDLFDLIVSSVEERCKKPSRELFQRFSARIGFPPQNIAFVGHEIEEIEGAKKAGFIAIALGCPEARADFHIQRLEELLRLPIWPEEKEAE
ncbi:MAG: HAD family hydrolase [Candidatus Bipolaricaulaceae bacterium]